MSEVIREVLLADKNKMPDEEQLSAVLGDTFRYWVELRTIINKDYVNVSEEWKHYGKKIGWLLKVIHKKVNLFFLVPCDKYFYLSFVFGDKAVTEILKSSLPEEMKSELSNARKYAEGRGLRVEVRNKKAMEHIITLIKIKIEIR